MHISGTLISYRNAKKAEPNDSRISISQTLRSFSGKKIINGDYSLAQTCNTKEVTAVSWFVFSKQTLNPDGYYAMVIRFRRNIP